MKNLFKIACLCLALMFISVSCSMQGFFIDDVSKARVAVIGMDYENSLVAPTLSGTVDDAYEVAASLKSIMEAKAVPVEVEYLVQEGFDYIFEVHCVPVDSIIENIKTSMENASEHVSHISGYYEGDDYIIRAQVDTEINAETIKQAIEEKYPTSAVCRYQSMRSASSYPSKANIIKTIKAASDLSETDLFVLYYSGHGETANVIPYEDLKTILDVYLTAEKITKKQYDALITLEMKSESEILGMMYLTEVDATVRDEIYNECKTYLLVNTHMKGALVTAPVASYEYYDFLDMEYVYTLLCNLKCKVVLIIDACYSGFASSTTFGGITVKDSFESFMQSKDYPNVIVMSASTPGQTSKVSAVMTEDKQIRRHSAFTIKLFEEFNWIHSTQKLTFLSVPYYTVNSDGTINQTTTVRGVEGYMSYAPSRATAAEIFDRISSNWAMTDQTPQRNDSAYEICLIP